MSFKYYCNIYIENDIIILKILFLYSYFVNVFDLSTINFCGYCYYDMNTVTDPASITLTINRGTIICSEQNTIQNIKMKDEKRSRFRFSKNKSPKQIHHWLFGALLLLAGSGFYVEYKSRTYQRLRTSAMKANYSIIY